MVVSQTTWATQDDVLALTAKATDGATLTAANLVIEVFSRRIYTIAAPNTGTRDLEWMKRAVAFEATWMPGQPDFWTRLDVSTIVEGRKAITLKEQTLLLAPMARIALSRVSWQKTRSIHIRSAFQDGLSPISSNPDSAGNDFYEQWDSMTVGR